MTRAGAELQVNKIAPSCHYDGALYSITYLEVIALYDQAVCW
jgi:hypothetical protein